jgi:hypothetical protein
MQAALMFLETDGAKLVGLISEARSDALHAVLEPLPKDTAGSVCGVVEKAIGLVARVVHLASEDELAASDEPECASSTRSDDVRASAEIDGSRIGRRVLQPQDLASSPNEDLVTGLALEVAGLRLELVVIVNVLDAEATGLLSFTLHHQGVPRDEARVRLVDLSDVDRSGALDGH